MRTETCELCPPPKLLIRRRLVYIRGTAIMQFTPLYNIETCAYLKKKNILCIFGRHELQISYQNPYIFNVLKLRNFLQKFRLFKNICMQAFVEMLTLAAFKMIAKRKFCIWDGVMLLILNLLGGCKYKIYNMTTCKFYIYTHPVKSKFTT